MLVKHYLSIPRLDQTFTAEELAARYLNQWDGLHAWFLGQGGRDSDLIYLQDTTNETVRRMTRFAQRLGEKHHNFKSRKKDYQHLAHIFAGCSDLQEAQKLSACVFGLFHTRHLWALEKDTEDIYQEIWDIAPSEAILKPRVRTYREKTKPQAVVSFPEEKAKTLKEYLLEKEAEQRLINSVVENKRIVLKNVVISDPYLRKTLLDWISKSLGNKDGLAKTQTGHKFRLSKLDEQFLLSDLCEEIKSIYPPFEELDWTHYEHRKSLVRVLQTASDHDLVKTVDGDIGGFSFSENNEVLYEVPLVARYFLRSFPKELTGFNTIDDFLNIDDLTSGEQQGVKRRHRIYRKLFLSPVMYSNGNNDPDFLYLRNFRNRIRDDVEKHTDFTFELYRNAALLTTEEKRAIYTLFPDNKAINDIVLQFAKLIREEKENGDIPLQDDGSLCLSPVDFSKWAAKCCALYSHGWSKQYREATSKELHQDLLAVLVDWQMAEINEDTGVIALKPLLARTIGDYPQDFPEGGEKNSQL